MLEGYEIVYDPIRPLKKQISNLQAQVQARMAEYALARAELVEKTAAYEQLRAHAVAIQTALDSAQRADRTEDITWRGRYEQERLEHEQTAAELAAAKEKLEALDAVPVTYTKSAILSRKPKGGKSNV